ncbi:MAG TPA: hypothetical protein PLD62_07590 [Candidatus Cloacimonadota bacterium]|nr:hypothetical protein [Candidatus Cloacimonadota bacterium]
MKKLLLTSGLLVAAIGSLFARSKYCLDNCVALAASVVVGTLIAFFTVLLISKILPRKKKAASCLTNILILIFWIACCFLVCFLIRTFLY